VNGGAFTPEHKPGAQGKQSTEELGHQHLRPMNWPLVLHGPLDFLDATAGRFGRNPLNQQEGGRNAHRRDDDRYKVGNNAATDGASER